VYPLPDLGWGRRIHAWPLTAAVRLGCNCTSEAVAAPERLDTRTAAAKAVGHRLRRTKPALAGVQDVLAPLNGIASHATYASGMLPYDPGKTALDNRYSLTLIPVG
jgi:hypothetical protein